jgi:hypothetical protein
VRIARTCVFCGGSDLIGVPAVLMPFVAHRALGYAPVEVTPEWGMRDIPNGLLHCRCNTLYCPQCSGVFLDQRFDNEEMSALYSGYRGEEYARLRDSYEPGYAARNNELLAAFHFQVAETVLERFLPDKPDVLDWGGGDGRNTPCRTLGGRCDVIDISGNPPVPGVGAVTPEEAAARHYDLVVLSHVLEHVPEPFELLNEVANTAGPDTLIYIEVPFEAMMVQLSLAKDRAACAASKRYWHEHINFFSPEALRQLAVRAGLTPVDTKVPAPAGIQYLLARKKTS